MGYMWKSRVTYQTKKKKQWTNFWTTLDVTCGWAGVVTQLKDVAGKPNNGRGRFGLVGDRVLAYTRHEW